MSEHSKANIDWVSDIVIKILCVIATGFLGVVVNSVQSMNENIKSLSENVFDLSSQSKVLNITIQNMEKRLDRLEAKQEKTQP